MFIEKVRAVTISITDPLAGAGINSVADLVNKALGYIMPLAGIILLIMIIYGGITYSMSAGDPGKTKQAQAILTNSIIGFIIVALAFAIRALITGALGL